MSSKERRIFTVHQPLTCVVNVIIIVLQGQGTPLDIVEARESTIHLAYYRHVKQLVLRHRKIIDLEDLFHRRLRFDLSLLLFAQVESQSFEDCSIVLLTVIKFDLNDGAWKLFP